MDTSLLLNYGILGTWTAYLLWEKHKMMNDFTNAIERNTEIIAHLTPVVETMKERLVREAEERIRRKKR